MVAIKGLNFFKVHRPDRNQIQKSSYSILPLLLHSRTGKNNVMTERSVVA